MDKLENTGILALEDGTVYRGISFGAAVTVVGEAVFNTSMTGYQEILTDPSYFGQIVTMTAPQIGNYGITSEDNEADKPMVSGFVVRDVSPVVSNWRARQSLPEYLQRNGIPGLSGIDTRALTKTLRVAGVLKACLSGAGISAEEAIRRAREWQGLVGEDYVKQVTCKAIYRWEEPPVEPFTVEGTAMRSLPTPAKRYPVVAFDMGAKRNIFRKLAYHGFDVTVVPADTDAATVRALQPAGIFVSNGPGDPAAVTYAHRTIAELMPEYPMFGICMGHQIIAHAMGAQTVKLKFGHRGANQPVKNSETGVVSITAQNHGFAANLEDLHSCGAIVTEFNMNDGTVAGLRHKEWPVFSVQYHPEAAPGPHDSDPLFAHFYALVAARAESVG